MEGGGEARKRGRDREGECASESEKEEETKIPLGNTRPVLTELGVNSAYTHCVSSGFGQRTCGIVGICHGFGCLYQKTSCVNLYLWKQAKWLLSHGLQSTHPKTNLVCNYAYLKI